MACDWFLFEVCDMLCMRAVIGLSEIVSYTVIGTNYIPTFACHTFFWLYNQAVNLHFLFV
jgi:hypothetical protein